MLISLLCIAIAGTGKTETGVHIAYVFAMLNRTLPERKCVLYCGPSNKAVDVALGKLYTYTFAAYRLCLSK